MTIFSVKKFYRHPQSGWIGVCVGFSYGQDKEPILELLPMSGGSGRDLIFVYFPEEWVDFPLDLSP